LIESAGQVISEVDKGGQIQAAVGGLRQRLAEAERKRKVNQVKQQLRELKAQEVQAINALSAQVLALHEAGSLTQPELVSLCKGVDDAREQIKEMEVELESLQPPPPQSAVDQTAPQSGPEARCPQCGAVVVPGASFCQTCGTGLQAEAESAPPILYCTHCGGQLRDTSRFCPQCGETVTRS
jgi:hypothetical protein